MIKWARKDVTCVKSATCMQAVVIFFYQKQYRDKECSKCWTSLFASQCVCISNLYMYGLFRYFESKKHWQAHPRCTNTYFMCPHPHKRQCNFWEMENLLFFRSLYIIFVNLFCFCFVIFRLNDYAMKTQQKKRKAKKSEYNNKSNKNKNIWQEKCIRE